MSIKNKELKQRIIEISYKKNLSHVGSCLSSVDIIEEIYQLKKPDEKFVLSSGHAGLALYCVLEKYEGKNAEQIFEHHGVHPDRCVPCGIDCSSGSLGHGLPIALGMALADRTKNVYCLVSDGESAEGSIYEALRIADENKVSNLKVYVNWNGWAAYRKSTVYIDLIEPQVQIVDTNVEYIPFLRGQIGHYLVMNEEQYNMAMEILQ